PLSLFLIAPPPPDNHSLSLHDALPISTSSVLTNFRLTTSLVSMLYATSSRYLSQPFRSLMKMYFRTEPSYKDPICSHVFMMVFSSLRNLKGVSFSLYS